MVQLLLLLVALAAQSFAAIDSDLVTSLPGEKQSVSCNAVVGVHAKKSKRAGWAGSLPSKHYSGYLPVTNGFLHYWFIESENSPSTAPVGLFQDFIFIHALELLTRPCSKHPRTSYLAYFSLAVCHDSCLARPLRHASFDLS